MEQKNGLKEWEDKFKGKSKGARKCWLNCQ